MAEATAHGHAHMPAHAADAHADTHQQHPIRLYLVVWGWLFILSTCSYLVDYFGLQGYLSWSLILLFMMLKAGLIVAVFMHMAWERLALIYAILVPPVLVLVFVAIMVFEADYTLFTRLTFFGRPDIGFGLRQHSGRTGDAACFPIRLCVHRQLAELVD